MSCIPPLYLAWFREATSIVIGDVVCIEALYGNVLSRRRFVKETFCRGDVLYMRQRDNLKNFFLKMSL
jgi:hypothetical protein